MVGIFGLDLVVVVGEAALHEFIIGDAKGEQHGLFYPVIDDPFAINLLGDPDLAAVQLIDCSNNGIPHLCINGAGIDVGAVFKGLFDDRLGIGHIALQLVCLGWFRVVQYSA